MTLFHTVPLTSGLALALCGGAAQAQDTAANHGASRPLLTLQMPALPDPVHVTLKPATTAEGEGHHSDHYGRLEGQRLAGLHIGRSDATRLYCRGPH
jgi:hypothetical protein